MILWRKKELAIEGEEAKKVEAIVNKLKNLGITDQELDLLKKVS